MSENRHWRAIREELDALRTTPLKSEAQIAAEVGRYLEEKRKPMYSGRLCGVPGREHKAGGPSASRRGRFATGRWA